MHLAYLVSRYPSISHTFILREVRELRRLGFEIDVASINPPDRPTEGLTEEEKQEAIRTFYVKAAGLAGALQACFAALSTRPAAFFAALSFAIRLGRLDLSRVLFGILYFVEAVILGHWMTKRGSNHLHVHFATPGATVGMLVAKVYPVTLSITVHGPDEFYDVPGYYLPQKIAASKLLCAISDYAKSQLIRIAPATEWDKVEITRLGVDPNIFSPRPSRQPGEIFEILCVGRLVSTKGQRVLLNVASQLLKASRRIHLRYIGDGPDRAALEQATQDLGITGSVKFEGAVNQDRIRSFYAVADVFVLPSFAEGIPVVLMEAMAMEIPCIATCITGIPELIRSGVDGLLVPPSNEAALFLAITQLMDDPGLRLRLAKAGRQRILESYNLTPSVLRLAEVFDKHLGAAA